MKNANKIVEIFLSCHRIDKKHESNCATKRTQRYALVNDMSYKPMHDFKPSRRIA